MPSKYVRTRPMQCPFYYGETSLEIKCKDTVSSEGLAGCATATCFTSTEDRSAYAIDFCAGCYRGCEIYRAFVDKIKYNE